MITTPVQELLALSDQHIGRIAGSINAADRRHRSLQKVERELAAHTFDSDIEYYAFYSVHAARADRALMLHLCSEIINTGEDTFTGLDGTTATRDGITTPLYNVGTALYNYVHGYTDLNTLCAAINDLVTEINNFI